MPYTYNYLYALTFVDFDTENKDVIYFKNKNEKISYFDLNNLFNGASEINFEKKNLLDVEMDVELKLTDIIKNEFGFNYLIIKEISTETYYFYFVGKHRYLNKGRMNVKCHLDIFTTYFDSIIVDGLIKRATFREFKADGTDVIYDNDSYTHIYSVDDTYNGKKFLQYDKTLQPHIVTNSKNATIDTWLENNVECWLYLYVDCYHTFIHKVNNSDVAYKTVEEFMSYLISTSFGVIAQPIYKTNNKMYVRYTDITDPDNPVIHNLPFSENAVDLWRNMNNGNEFVYSSKLSKQPPFSPFEENTTPLDVLRFMCSIVTENGDLYFDFGNVTSIDDVQLIQPYTKIYYNSLQANDTDCQCLFEFTAQSKRFYNNDVSSVIKSYYKTRMSKTDYLDTSNVNFWKQPNATSVKNIELKITYNGQDYTTTPSKIDTDNAIIEMQETICPDISKTYVRWKPTSYYTFRSYNSNTLTGGLFNDDTSIPLGSTKLQEVLAQSKNFFLQRAVNIGVGGLLDLASTASKMDVGGVAKSLAHEQLNEVNYGFNLDNIENAPSHLNRASGNALFNTLTKDYGLHLEIWMMTEEDLTNIKQYYERYGEPSNTIGSKYDFVEKHKYFDYVEMDVYYLYDPSVSDKIKLPNEIKEEFKRKFNRGIRFWYDGTKLYNYTLYNYEVAFE